MLPCALLPLFGPVVERVSPTANQGRRAIADSKALGGGRGVFKGVTVFIRTIELYHEPSQEHMSPRRVCVFKARQPAAGPGCRLISLKCVKFSTFSFPTCFFSTHSPLKIKNEQVHLDYCSNWPLCLLFSSSKLLSSS